MSDTMQPPTDLAALAAEIKLELTLAIFERACADIKDGSLDALAWMLYAGMEIDDAIHNNKGAWALAFCREHAWIIEAATPEQAWGFDVNTDEWNEKSWRDER